MHKSKKFAIVTCCLDDWGGSEELWSRTIPLMLEAGVKNITIYKQFINQNYHQFRRLKAMNITLKSFAEEEKIFNKLISTFGDMLLKVGGKIGLLTYNWNKPAKRLNTFLKENNPDLVLISQGINFDGLIYAYQCLKLNIPYIIVCHKAVDFFWPTQADRIYMRQTLIEAKKCYFVSDHNRKLTEEQFGLRLKNAEIVINPVKVSQDPLPYPKDEKKIKLACVGRLFVIDKGQDMLIRVLSEQKWKERNIHVSFIGSGPDYEALSEMAKLLKVDNISFPGYNGDLHEIWADHHALILPSRSEGLPLTITEAMTLGRIAIVTNAGGNREIVQDNITGFVGEATEAGVGEVLEAAWNERDRWSDMGILAARYIKETIPLEPERIFADALLKAINNE